MQCSVLVRIILLIGEKFGRLLVIKKAFSKHGRSRWICQCDCGKTYNVLGHNLRKGKTKSCGCLRKESARNLISFAKEKNFLSPGEAAFNVMYYTYKQHANERGLDFSLEKDSFRHLTQMNCYYCGDEPKDFFKPKAPNGGYLSNGIDRKDNAMGYTIENCVPCCRICNQMKSNKSYEDFITRCWKITRGHKPSTLVE
jgi:hypothetical protein